jgi:hypothetical protein
MRLADLAGSIFRDETRHGIYVMLGVGIERHKRCIFVTSGNGDANVLGLADGALDLNDMLLLVERGLISWYNDQEVLVLLFQQFGLDESDGLLTSGQLLLDIALENAHACAAAHARCSRRG